MLKIFFYLVCMRHETIPRGIQDLWSVPRIVPPIAGRGTIGFRPPYAGLYNIYCTPTLPQNIDHHRDPPRSCCRPPIALHKDYVQYCMYPTSYRTKHSLIQKKEKKVNFISCTIMCSIFSMFWSSGISTLAAVWIGGLYNSTISK